jgi:hypothetical protein
VSRDKRGPSRVSELPFLDLFLQNLALKADGGRGARGVAAVLRRIAAEELFFESQTRFTVAGYGE